MANGLGVLTDALFAAHDLIVTAAMVFALPVIAKKEELPKLWFDKPRVRELNRTP
jgi:hypothetical protein